MGIGISTLAYLLTEHKARPLHGKALTLGRMDISFTMENLVQGAQAVGVKLVETPVKLSLSPALAAKGNICDETFFKALGVTSLRALDISPYQDADLIWDLNRTGLPQEWRGAFDLIFDGGTMEHVFNFPNGLANIHELLAVGGRIIHASPANNYLDHGLYQISPGLLYYYYLFNGYQINQVLLHRVLPKDFFSAVGEFYHYDPAKFGDNQLGAPDGAVWNVFVTATRTAQSTSHNIPVHWFCNSSELATKDLPASAKPDKQPA